MPPTKKEAWQEPNLGLKGTAQLVDKQRLVLLGQRVPNLNPDALYVQNASISEENVAKAQYYTLCNSIDHNTFKQIIMCVYGIRGWNMFSTLIGMTMQHPFLGGERGQHAALSRVRLVPFECSSVLGSNSAPYASINLRTYLICVCLLSDVYTSFTYVWRGDILCRSPFPEHRFRHGNLLQYDQHMVYVWSFIKLCWYLRYLSSLQEKQLE